LISGLVTSD